MASVVFSIGLSAAGASFASSIGASIFVGSLITGIGGTIGGLLGGLVDDALLGVGDQGTNVTTGSLDLPQVTTSTYGKVIPAGYGTVRVAGNIIWMSDARVTTVRETEEVKTGKFSSETVTRSETRIVEIDFALSLLGVDSLLREDLAFVESTDEAVVSFANRPALVGYRRIWANSELIYDARSSLDEATQTNEFEIEAFYDGQESQNPDSYIESIEGAGNVPAFRGLGYLVFKNYQIQQYGDRIPNIQVEVVASLPRLPVEEQAEGIAVDDENFIHVISQLRRTIAKIDPVDYKIRSTIGREGLEEEYLGALDSHPWRLAIDDTDEVIWVTCKGNATVQKISQTSETITETIDVGNYPYDVVLDDNRDAWVTFPMLNRISKIDRATSAITNYTVTGCPQSITKSADGDLWITTNQQVVRFDPGTGLEVARIDVDVFCWGVAFNPVTNSIWVTSPGLDIIRIIDVATNTIIRNRNTGTYPTAIHCNPNESSFGAVAVSTFFGNQVKVYSKTYQELASYGTVAFPGPVFFMEDGRVVVSQTKYDFAMILESR